MIATVRVAAAAGSGADAHTAADAALQAVVRDLDGAAADLVVVFIGAAHGEVAPVIGDLVRDRLDPSAFLGVTVQGVVAGPHEIESPDAVSLWAAHLPGATLTSLRFPAPGSQGEDTGLEWPDVPEGAAGLVVLADPFGFPAPTLLAWLEQQRPGLPVTGGLASGAGAPGTNRLLLDEAAYTDGAVGVAVAGVRLRHLVSQGCRPVGAPYVVTRAQGNVIAELGGLPAVERIREAYEMAGAADQALMRRGLQIGIAIDEYADTHDRGDFVIRGVIGAEPETGAVAVGDVVPVGRTVRFQVRDAASADEDLRDLLGGLDGSAAAGALLFTCNGRGSLLFGAEHHDAQAVSAALGGAPLAGFFAAGELGPVGDRSYLHGFTASLLVVEDEA